MDLRPIKSSADHEWALGEISTYFEEPPEPQTEAGDRFEILLDLVASYEARQYPLPDLDPIDALRAFMDSAGKAQSDLSDLIGSRSRASEILARKRTLTVDMIHRLSRQWGMPAELLIVPYRRVT